MNIRIIALALVALLSTAGTLSAGEPHPWLHFSTNGREFHSVKVTDDLRITHSDTHTEGATTTISNGSEVIEIALSEFSECTVGSNVPTIYITTPDSPELTELVDKETYLSALIEIDGNGLFDDLEPTEVSIKGRGNSTWSFAKKPYRLKFSKKTSLPGCRKSKNYALIANYIDGTLTRNAVALAAAQLLGMPFTNSAQPVRVYFNGVFKGAYMLTEKIGISSSSVDIDENAGILFELDNNYDEDFKFRSPLYDLPVMVKDPDFSETAEICGLTPEELFGLWQTDFTEFEAKVAAGTAVDGEDIDMASLVDYMLVYNLCGNQEINHPKSLYINKESFDTPYRFGPVWDFDWAFTYMYGGKEEMPPQIMLLDPDPGQGGGYMLIDLCRTPEFLSMFAERWAYFTANLLPQLFDYMDSYAATIRPSAIENGVVWPAEPGCTTSSFDFDANYAKLKQWIADRAEFISSHPRFGLYDPEVYP